MQYCSKTLDCTAISETWMSVENVKNLETVQKFEIFIFYFYNLLIIRLNSVDYTTVL